MCILNFGVFSGFEFLAYEGMHGNTIVFKEVLLQTLNFVNDLQVFVLSVHFGLWGVFSF